MSSLERGSPPLAYLSYGAESRKPVVLLHDIAADSRSWHEAAIGLANDFHIVAPDLAGHGQSAPLHTQTPTLASYAADVAALLDHLAIGHAAIAGTGFGGLVALETALTFPAKVTGLAIADATLLPLPGDDAHAAHEAALARAEDIASRFGMAGLARATAGELDDVFLAALASQRYGTLSGEGFTAALHARRNREDLATRVTAIDQPVLVLTGDASPLRQASEHLAELLPHSRFDLVEDTSLGAATTRAHTFATAIGELLDRAASTP